MRDKLILAGLLCVVMSAGAQTYETDSFEVADGTVRLTFLGHASLMIEYAGKVIHVDPVRAEADYTKLPKADLVLVTHDHGDHLDLEAIRAVSKTGTEVILNGTSRAKLGSGTALANGERRVAAGLTLEAVPAYNTTAGRDRFHPKGRDNGYILTMGGKRLYIAGDTEDTVEMKALKDIWIAFLPVNQPYTMVPAQAVAAAKAFRPRILYPYHYGNTRVQEIAELLSAEKGIEVRIRKLS